MGKPEVYGHCKAGCNWRVPHYDEFKKCAALAEINLSGGSATVNLLEKYKAKSSATVKGCSIVVTLPETIEDAASATVGNKIYLFGGFGSGGETQNIYEFDPDTNTVTKKSATVGYTLCKSNAAAVAVGKDIYICGKDDSVYDTHLKKYDTKTGTVTSVNVLNCTYSTVSAAAIGTRLYIFGEAAALSRVVFYDVKDNTWEQLQEYEGTCPNAVAVGTKIYFFGAKITNSGTADNIRIYDTDSGSLITCSEKMPFTSASVATVAVGSKIYFYKNGSGSRELFYFDTLTNKIDTLGVVASLNYNSAACSAIANRIYSFGSLLTVSGSTQDISPKIERIITPSNNATLRLSYQDGSYSLQQYIAIENDGYRGDFDFEITSVSTTTNQKTISYVVNGRPNVLIIGGTNLSSGNDALVFTGLTDLYYYNKDAVMVGEAAGFGTPTASITELPSGSVPTVSVEASGEDTAKVFSFEFGIPLPESTLKGKTDPAEDTKASVGQLYLNTTSKQLFYCASVDYSISSYGVYEWLPVKNVSYGSSAPSSGNIGQLYVDTDTGEVYIETPYGGSPTFIKLAFASELDTKLNKKMDSVDYTYLPKYRFGAAYILHFGGFSESSTEYQIAHLSEAIDPSVAYFVSKDGKETYIQPKLITAELKTKYHVQSDIGNSARYYIPITDELIVLEHYISPTEAYYYLYTSADSIGTVGEVYVGKAQNLIDDGYASYYNLWSAQKTRGCIDEIVDDSTTDAGHAWSGGRVNNALNGMSQTIQAMGTGLTQAINAKADKGSVDAIKPIVGGTLDPDNTTDAKFLGRLYINEVTGEMFYAARNISTGSYEWRSIVPKVTKQSANPNTEGTVGYLGQLCLVGSSDFSPYDVYICVMSDHTNNMYLWHKMCTTEAPM